MKKDTFHDRERAEEEAYFQQRDAKLLAALRQKSELSKVAHALAEKLQSGEPALLDQIKKLGVTLDTGAAFVLAPLVEVAWADGNVSHAERKSVLHIAAQRGIVAGSADYRQLLEWLDRRPPEAILQAALEAIRIGISVLPPAERKQRIAAMINTCEEVARAAGGLEGLFDLSDIDGQERSVIAAIRDHLNECNKSGGESRAKSMR